MLRGALVSLIFTRTLALRDGAYDEATAVTHMSVDVDRIAMSMESVPETWARMVEVAIGIWLLSTQLGAASVVPIVVVVSMFILVNQPPQLLTNNRTNYSLHNSEHPSIEIYQ